MLSILTDLLSAYDPESPHFRPTEIYNESWLVKLIMSQASSIPAEDHPLSFLPGSSWYSEALLPTAFKAQKKGDHLAESRTNADVVIGHFRIGQKAKADFELTENAKQFTVVEAKVGSPLSSGVIHANYFDQAARNVACMAESLALADLPPASLERLDFIVLAPAKAIDEGTFAEKMTKTSIQSKTEQRVAAYQGDLDRWLKEKFLPILERVQLHSLSWEDSIDWIRAHNLQAAAQVDDFYQLCLKYN
ncbi:MAG: hypothetical protein WBB64_08385 [Anaerolineales bacterium]